MGFTHKQLVDIAYTWLLKRGGCGVAFKELKSTAKEIPDVIGFDSWHSIVIECKISRSDFLQDKNKPHRTKGMGVFRFFICPKDMITVDELPEKWGLIYVSEDESCRVAKDVRKQTRPEYDHANYNPDTYHTDRYINAFNSDVRAEQKVMYTALRRLFIRGFMKHIYEEGKTGSDAEQLILLNDETA